jgi:hypothetical protein
LFGQASIALTRTGQLAWSVQWNIGSVRDGFGCASIMGEARVPAALPLREGPHVPQIGQHDQPARNMCSSTLDPLIMPA